MNKIPLFLTETYLCSYLDAKQARSVFVHPSYPLSATVYGQLMAQGFRRSGDEAYKPYCPACTQCVPIRLAVAEFKPNRSQRRCWQKNSSVEVSVKPPVFEQAHYDMYLRYQMMRHTDGDMARSSPEEYIGFLGGTWGDTAFIEFSIAGQLAAVAVVDRCDDAWSAVYTFFDPQFSDYGLGVYAVLWQIEQAKQAGKTFLYLGFWIEACKKMAYKSNYQPMQLLIDNQWIEVTSS
jgi:arginyl-tRNA--protein-N-Asp/Glu arginylyltransferase